MYINVNIMFDNKNIENNTQKRTRGYISRTRAKVYNLENHAEVSEKSIERHLVELAREHGMLCLKYSNPNMVGYPDRLLALPGGGVVWIELKSKGRKPSKIQEMRMAQLRGMGHDVRVIDNKADIDELIKAIAK